MQVKSIDTVNRRTGEVTGRIDVYLDDDGNEVRRRQVVYGGNDGRTNAEFRDEVNINSIARRVGGLKPIAAALSSDEVLLADFSAGADYTEAMERINRMQDAFRALPAGVKRLCQNDPALLVNRLGEAAGSLELLDAGLDRRFLDPLVAPQVEQLEADRRAAAAAEAAAAVPPVGTP